MDNTGRKFSLEELKIIKLYSWDLWHSNADIVVSVGSIMDSFRGKKKITNGRYSCKEYEEVLNKRLVRLII